MENIKNIIIAILSFSLLYPLYFSYFKYNDFYTSLLLLFMAFSSSIHHLFESHQNKMNGFNCNKKLSILLQKIDVFFVAILFLRLLYLILGLLDNIRQIPDPKYIILHNPIHISLFISLIFLYISKYKFKDENVTHYCYIIFHILWRITISYYLEIYLKFVKTDYFEEYIMNK